MSACLWMVAVQFLQRISVFSPTKSVEGATTSSETRTGGEQGSARVQGGLSLC